LAEEWKAICWSPSENRFTVTYGHAPFISTVESKDGLTWGAPAYGRRHVGFWDMGTIFFEGKVHLYVHLPEIPFDATSVFRGLVPDLKPVQETSWAVLSFEFESLVELREIHDKMSAFSDQVGTSVHGSNVSYASLLHDAEFKTETIVDLMDTAYSLITGVANEKEQESLKLNHKLYQLDSDNKNLARRLKKSKKIKRKVEEILKDQVENPE
jgi:hypothetical protein